MFKRVTITENIVATRPTYFKSLPRGEGFFMTFFSNCVKLEIWSSLCCISKSMRSCFSSTTMFAFNLASVNHAANEIIYGSSSSVAKRLPMGHSQKLWNFLNLIIAKSRPKLMTIRQQISSKKTDSPFNILNSSGSQIMLSLVVSTLKHQHDVFSPIFPSISKICFMQISRRATQTAS